MNYQEALAYLYSLSDFERGGPYTHDPSENLPRESYLLAQLGNPQQDYSCTLIAGTKGKGSTATFIERVLREAGLRTGLYTQPDLHTFRERIRVNGHLINENTMAALMTELRAVVERIQREQRFPSFITYEVATALALLYFSRQHVQHAVLEVGLGGRLDATNVTQPLVSVITSISYDHMQVLGNTLTEIATEKAGIIKPNGLVVTSAQAPEALLAIADVARRQHAELIRVAPSTVDLAQAEVTAGQLPAPSYRYCLEQQSEEHQRFTVWTPEHTYTGLEISLLGQHQLENATAALATLDILRQRHAIAWNEADLRAGLLSAQWSARIEVIGQRPTLIVDGAHNTDSVQKLLAALRTSFTFHRLIIVLSVARDKDLAGILQELHDIDVVVLTRMANPRVASLEHMAALFAQHAPHVDVHTAATSSEAIELALDLADPSDLVCATGSLYLAAEILRWSATRGNQSIASKIEGIDHT
ncbi:MAG TPA: folylpolyglutamate synthase/dihydrofolate synthase family protein [Ktedonobacteraceae bacterium]|nr:folylpolyglutamate synthase/dihydrofolate synthase family protein [Ktedonobacteraceae bacterium]